MSEFFSVTLDSNIIMDDGRVSRSTTWSSEQILEEILSHVQNSSGGLNLKYREINDLIQLNPNQELKKNYDLGDTSIMITTLYLDIQDGSNFRFQILDKVDDGFALYDSYKVNHYTDSVFIPYKDKDVDTNSLHIKIKNFNMNSSVQLNIKILGLEVQNG
ncbi:hypothetical protein KM803_15895 [Clostridium tyrobutyricum]|uniref:hypothetical protein n=1 Tax=Clostridium tyrobutyricum TaxID=1519 RepID=UPI001C37EE34|nr:hypothetical protein [Clostridium tyrobutyricum]MBV4432783.1 hypothetical protein [Clostridium tyrobutyricum]